jgi:predicted enzyme related to lactoylglutathione lyase
MTDTTEYAPGTPSWVDLGTPDIPAAATFYGTLFGWTAEPIDDPDAGGYTMLSLDGKLVAALGPQQNPGPPYWTTYVSVEDADKTAEITQTAGGSVLAPPMDVFDAGRMAVLADPTGAAFAIWQPGTMKGAQVAGVPNSYCWTELTSRDTGAAKKFYGEVFGWEAREGGMEGAPEYTEFKNGERSVAGMMATPAEVPAEVPSYWMPYFEVNDTAKTIGEATALGGSVMVDAQAIPGVGTFAILRDPQGAAFGVIKTETAS